MTPKISIIIPCYKSEKYIKQCVESIIAQTFTDWEAIFIIDAPDAYDQTISYLNSKLDSRIKIFSNFMKTNPAYARNTGVQHSVGEYIAFLDADDWWYPNKLEKQIRYMDTHTNIKWCWAYAIVHDGKKEYMLENAWNKPKADEMLPFQTFVLRRDLVCDIIKSDGKLLDDSLPQIDDYDLFQRLKKYENYGFHEPLSHYRYHSEGLTSSTGSYKILRMQMKISIKRHCWNNIPHLIRLYFHLKIRDTLNKVCNIKRRLK